MDCLRMVVGRMLKGVSSMTKGELKMKNKIIGLVMVMMLAAGTAFAAQDTAEVDIYVTPGNVTASLTALTTWYNFGTVNLAASSHSVTGVVLQNGSASTVLMEKSITALSLGALVYPPAAQDDIALYCLGDAATMPAPASFGATHEFTNVTGTYDTLADSAAADIIAVPVGKGTTTWYKITMPSSVSSSAQRKFDLTFRATTN